MAACSQSRLNSNSCPESVRRYGNSSLNATMIFVNCDGARSSRGPAGSCLRRKQFPLERIGFYPAAKRMNGIHKLVNILKSLVHRGVTQVRHFVDRAQFFEHFSANCLRRNFTASRFQFVDDFVHHILQCKKTGRAFLKSFRDASSQFAAIKRLMCSVTFHYAQVRPLDFLIGSKAIFAFQTFATASDARTIPRLTGIDDFVITRPALGATHSMETPITIPFVVVSM